MVNLPRSCSIKLFNEILLNTCESAWTASANATSTADATIFKVGANSAKHVIGDAFGTGLAAYGASGSAALNIASGGYTHLKFWMYCVTAIEAGQLQIGLDNAADGATAVYVDIPAIAAGAWTRVILPLTTDQVTLTSLDSIALKVVRDAGAQTLYIDDIRLCAYEFSGTAGIEVAEASTGNGEIWQMPYTCRLANVYDSPQDIDLTWMLGDGNVGGVTSIMTGQTAADLDRAFNMVRLELSEDLGAGDSIRFEAVEA